MGNESGRELIVKQRLKKKAVFALYRLL